MKLKKMLDFSPETRHVPEFRRSLREDSEFSNMTVHEQVI